MNLGHKKADHPKMTGLVISCKYFQASLTEA